MEYQDIHPWRAAIYIAVLCAMILPLFMIPYVSSQRQANYSVTDIRLDSGGYVLLNTENHQFYDVTTSPGDPPEWIELDGVRYVREQAHD